MNSFRPPLYLRNSMTQTWLASTSWRKRAFKSIDPISREIIVDCSEGAQLLGYLTHTEKVESKGLVVLLHGWEGNAHAPYLTYTGQKLLDDGFDIFRLNMRDHGTSHHLNRGIFMGTLVEETFSAVNEVIEKHNRSENSFLIGVSIGGSYVLRIAKECGTNPIEGLKRVIALNPPLDPYDATIRLDKNHLIRKHFLEKWKKSIRIKQEVYPQLYKDLHHVFQSRDCFTLTERLIPLYSQYKDAVDYFNNYNIQEDVLDQVAVPVTVITAEDDPIINVEDFYKVSTNENVELLIEKYGGHCGFMENLRGDSWYHKIVLERFNSHIS